MLSCGICCDANAEGGDSARLLAQRSAAQTATDFEVVRRAPAGRELPKYGHIYYERSRKARSIMHVCALARVQLSLLVLRAMCCGDVLLRRRTLPNIRAASSH